jgi:hypothetical protein
MQSSLRAACDIFCAYLDTLAGEPEHRSWIQFYLDVDLPEYEPWQSRNMSDYFSEYPSYVGAKGLPSPAETPYTTPYETPGFLRSKRNSRATTIGSARSREASSSPPPLPVDVNDYTDKPREGRYGSLDPRRFTPTLHANLVSEILSLRRELDSKNNLVENLETSLATAKTDNEVLSEELTTSAKEVRNAKQQVAQMEHGTYEALETMVRERDNANDALQELKAKLEVTQKKTKGQDEDLERTQTIWEREKEQWENERRQLEMRVHVTETRLRSFVDEMAAQQASIEEMPAQPDDLEDPDTFKDSAVGNDIDAISIKSSYGKKHTRNVSSLSSKTGFRTSVFLRAADTPEPFAKPGNSLADELGIDEEDEETEGDLDDTESLEEELQYHERRKSRLDSRHNSMVGDMDSKAKRVLGLSGDMSVSPTVREFPSGIRDDEVTSRSEIDCVSPSTPNFPKHLLEPVVPSARNSKALDIARPERKVQYVDTGYQPSPPSSPAQNKHKPEPLHVSLPSRATPTVRISSDKEHGQLPMRHPVSLAANTAVSPISPPETPVVDGTWSESKRAFIASPKYSSTSTQTEIVAPVLGKHDLPKQGSLEVPIPQIAIHPATSRPSSPRPYALPPNTKNAGAQVNIPWRGKDASMQTEEIRIDQRPVKLPAHLLPSHVDNLAESAAAAAWKARTAPVATQPKAAKRNPSHKPKISTDLPMLSSFPSPPMRSPTETSFPTHTRDGSSNNFGKMPLKAIPLPKPTLAPAFSMDEVAGETSKGPLNRSSQFGVSNQNRTSRQLAEIDHASDASDHSASEAGDQAGSMPVINASGRFEGPDLSQFNFDNFMQSPQRRPTTANSYDAAPAPSVSSSRHNSVRAPSSKRPPPARSSAQLKTHSRSPSFGSVASSSNFSTQSALPPHAIPKRSSSRFPAHTHVEGAHSPTPAGNAVRGSRVARGGHQRQGSLRKVQSAVSMRGRTGKLSPQKPRRRRRSPKLTPVQSMAFESPKPTKFPIPELPTPLQQSLAFDWGMRSAQSPIKRPDTATTAPAEESQLIDSIAGTMVGEWMWKYMRKRKSFGVDAAEAFTARNGNVEENGSSLTSHGERHKRWVWLSPYERTIMWDSKQPSSGTALLGKKGRKRKSSATHQISNPTFVLTIHSYDSICS